MKVIDSSRGKKRFTSVNYRRSNSDETIFFFFLSFFFFLLARDNYTRCQRWRHFYKISRITSLDGSMFRTAKMTKIGRGIKVEVEYFWKYREKIVVFLDFSIFFFFSSNYRVSAASINASTRSELIIESIETKNGFHSLKIKNT